MTTRTVVCPVCEAEVPYGRLSCAACGTLLASVAGVARRGRASANGGSNGAAGAPRTRGRRAEPAWTADGATAPTQTPSILLDWTGPLPTGASAAAEPAATPDAAPVDAPAAADASPTQRVTGILRRGRKKQAVVEAAAQDVPVAAAPVVPDTTRPPAVPDDGPPLPDWRDPSPAPEWSVTPPEPDWIEPAPEPTWPAAPSFPAWRAQRPPEPGSVVDAGVEPDGPPTPASAGPAVIPGAYVAPKIVPSTATTINGRPATATGIAAASIAEGTVASIPAAARPGRWFSVPAATPATSPDTTPAPGRAGLFSDLPFKAPADLPGWAVAIGGVLGTLAFVLPWAANGLVIGGEYGLSYFSSWGLANPASLVLMAASLVVVLLTVIPTRVPTVIRGGVLPLLFGGLFLGVAWVYATGPFGLGWGTDALAVGGLLFVIGGGLGQWRARPRTDEAPAGDTDRT